MIILIQGLTGAGKTWFMTRLIHKEWLAGAKIYNNFPLCFENQNENTQRWYNLTEIYYLQNGIIAIDEAQKLLDARRWASLPLSFAEMIAQHRKHHLDIYTTTQHISHIDVRMRTLVHELYECKNIFRFPRNERSYPILQFISVIHRKRLSNDENGRITWSKFGRTKFFFISKYFTKKLYESYADVGFNRYVCKTKFEKKRWLTKIYSRELVNSGKARL